MRQAYDLAQKAYDLSEVPVGAVIVLNNQVIGKGYNQTISLADPTAHAEIQAIRAAAKHIGNFRLCDATLYVTLEPCLMCSGAMIHSRLKRVVFGAFEPKAGFVMSTNNMAEMTQFNHQFDTTSGVLASQCGDLLSQFFKERRLKKKQLKLSAQQSDSIN